MSGISTRVARLFDGKKRVVISALDHVMEYGDQPGIEDAGSAISNCLGTDALLLSRFMLKRHPVHFESRDSPLPVIRINWTSGFYYPLGYRGGFTSIATEVDEAVEAGGELVICSLFLENEDERMETENVRLFSEVVRQKERLGIPLIGECYVIEHAEMSEQQVHDKVKRVTRVMAELGADLIKCFLTIDFEDIVANLPVPAFTIGAEKLDSDLAVLEKARASVGAGARGIIFGRNIFMSDRPRELIAALNRVMNDGVSSEDALSQMTKGTA